jgi:hypothetical protein
MVLAWAQKKRSYKANLEKQHIPSLKTVHPLTKAIATLIKSLNDESKLESAGIEFVVCGRIAYLIWIQPCR